MSTIVALLVGVVIGVVFETVILRLFGIGLAKINKNIDHIE